MADPRRTAVACFSLRALSLVRPLGHWIPERARARERERERMLPVPEAFLVVSIAANLYDDPIDCERCIETATPLANALGVTIDSSHGFELW